MDIKEILLQIKKEKGQIHLRFLPELSEIVMKETSFLDEYNPSNSERIYCILNDIKEKPLCTCGKPVKFNAGVYKTFCSTKCSNNDKNKKETTKKVLLEKYGVDNAMKVDYIKEKSKEGLKKYIENNKEDIIKNRTKLSLEKYNTTHPMKSEIVKDKLKSTMMKKYGEDNAMKVDYIKNKNHSNNSSLKDTFISSINNNPNRKEFLNEVTPLFDISKVNIKNTLNQYKCNHCNTIFEDWVDSTYKFIPRCPICKPKFVSNDELLLRKFIEDNYNGNIIYSDRNILNGKELDIYLPDLKLAIEYDGLYWHRYPLKSKSYHIDKTKECEKLGIRLIHIFSDEWLSKSSIVKNKLLYLLNAYNDNKIYARKCHIKEIDTKTKNEFLNSFHIQGKDSASIRLGLYYNKTLVSVMTFCKPRISLGQKTNTYNYELSRFASNNEFLIIGGFSKLFSYFKKNYEWDSIITYADMRWSQGNVYIKNGWNFLHESKPNYWYFNSDDRRYHRYTFRKDKIVELFNEDSSLSEFEIMSRNGYNKIYDCGNMVFEFKK